MTEAMQTFREALGLDSNQQTAKEHLEKLQQQLKLMEQVGHLLIRTNSCLSLHMQGQVKTITTVSGSLLRYTQRV